MVTQTSTKIKNQQLECVPCIQYPIKFKKGHTEVQALIDFDNKVNIMTLAYATILRLYICPTDIETQKIDGFTLSTYDIILVNFQLKDKLKKTYFFQKIILVANTIIEIVLGISFLVFSKMEINFAN